MSIMVPVFALEALQHIVLVVIYAILVVRLAAMAIEVKVVLIILILFISIVFFFEQLAGHGQFTVTTVAPKIHLGIKLVNFMAIMTVYHAS